MSTQTLKPIKYIKAAHMVYGTAVTFAPDASCLLSVSSDASAVAVPLRRGRDDGSRSGGGGGGSTGLLMLLLAVLVALVAVLLGMARYAAQEGMLHPSHLPSWVPPDLISTVVGGGGSSGSRAGIEAEL